MPSYSFLVLTHLGDQQGSWGAVAQQLHRKRRVHFLNLSASMEKVASVEHCSSTSEPVLMPGIKALRTESTNHV
ncbi:hypothetical protein GW17_00003018 [Ensete ventricosum]|nr:hypothetical protein GW17_00003018 [Ensete ventricosum]